MPRISQMGVFIESLLVDSSRVARYRSIDPALLRRECRSRGPGGTDRLRRKWIPEFPQSGGLRETTHRPRRGVAARAVVTTPQPLTSQQKEQSHEHAEGAPRDVGGDPAVQRRI